MLKCFHIIDIVVTLLGLLQLCWYYFVFLKNHSLS